MNSKLPDDWVSAYHDGELSDVEREAADRLLRTSETARRELEQFRLLSGVLRSLPVNAAPVDLRQHVLQAAERGPVASAALEQVGTSPRENHQARRLSKRWQSASVAVAAVVLMTTSVLLWNAKPQRPTISRSESRQDESIAMIGDHASFDSETEETPAAGLSSMASITNSLAAPTEGDMLASNGIVANDELELKDHPSEMSSSLAMMGAAPPAPHASLNAALEEHMLHNPQLLGSIFQYFPSDADGDHVAVIEMTVIDVRKSAGILQVLLSQREVPDEQTLLADSRAGEDRVSIDGLNTLADGEKATRKTSTEKSDSDKSDSDKSDKGSSELEQLKNPREYRNQSLADLNGQAENETVGSHEELIAVFVQATPEQLAETVKELNLVDDVVELSLHPPLQANVEQLASNDDAIWMQLDESLRRVANEPLSRGDGELLADTTAEKKRRSGGKSLQALASAESQQAARDQSRSNAPGADGQRAKVAMSKKDNANKTDGKEELPQGLDDDSVAAKPPADRRQRLRVESDAERWQVEDADVAVALKPGQTPEMFMDEITQSRQEIVNAIRERSSYQMLLEEPNSRGFRAGAALSPAESPLSRNLERADQPGRPTHDNRKLAQRSANFKQEGTRGRVIADKKRESNIDASDQPETVSSGRGATETDAADQSFDQSRQQSVKVLFVFTRPREMSEPASPPPDSRTESEQE